MASSHANHDLAGGIIAIYRNLDALRGHAHLLLSAGGNWWHHVDGCVGCITI